MITQEFLSQCSDEQINKGVVWAKVSELNLTDYNKRSSTAMFKWYGPPSEHRSYCTNPNDIMPIAESCCMSIEFPHPELGDTGQVSAYIHNDTDVCVEFNDMSKYMRAIAEVYILMSVNK